MASKRALQLQLLPVRAASTLFRAQCMLPRQIAPRCAVPVTRTVTGPQSVFAQTRWHSGIPEEQRSKLYEFDDIVKIVEATDATDKVLIDVREPHEYNEAAIPTAINIPVTSQPDALLLPADEFEDRFGFQKPPVTKELVFYCKAGVRSAAAGQIARHGGYDKVGEYRGSFLDWERKGGVSTKAPADTHDRPGKGEPENPVISEEPVKKKY